MIEKKLVEAAAVALQAIDLEVLQVGEVNSTRDIIKDCAGIGKIIL